MKCSLRLTLQDCFTSWRTEHHENKPQFLGWEHVECVSVGADRYCLVARRRGRCCLPYAFQCPYTVDLDRPSCSIISLRLNPAALSYLIAWAFLEPSGFPRDRCTSVSSTICVARRPTIAELTESCLNQFIALISGLSTPSGGYRVADCDPVPE